MTNKKRLSPGMFRRVVWYKISDVSEMLSASIFRATYILFVVVSLYAGNLECRVFYVICNMTVIFHSYSEGTELSFLILVQIC